MFQKIKIKINLKLLFLIIFFLVLLTVVFFSSPLVVTSDSSWYYWYTGILDKQIDFLNWPITRGPSFPFILWIFKHLFGASDTGILVGFYVVYIMLLAVSVILIREILKKSNCNKRNFIYWGLFIVFIVFNPIILGYSHTLLTEAITPTFVLITTYFSYLWKDVLWKKSKLKTILYTILFSILIVFMWFVKQPYAAIIIFIIGISAILISISKKSIKIFIEKIGTLFVSCIILLISIFGWNEFLKINGVNTKASNSTESFLSKGIIAGVSSYYIELPKKEYCDIDYISKTNLTRNEKQKIKTLAKNNNNWCNYITLYSIYEENKYVSKNAVIIKDNNGLTTSDSLKFLVKNTIKNPKYTVLAYSKNYLSTINLYPIKIINNNYISTKGQGSVYVNENQVHGLATYYGGSKCWWEKSEWNNNKEILIRKDVNYMINFCSNKEENKWINNIIQEISPMYLNIFKIIMLLTFPLFIISFIMFLKHNNSSKFFMVTILFGSAFLHVLFHAALGALIDRYAYIAFPSVILGLIILLIPNKTNVLKEEVKNMKKNKPILNKSIFVIPAYNESKHIVGVIKDINKNMPEADIVVINDYSKDNTKEVVEQMNVPCLNVPFNMGYAMAVQTGIKYAYENGYDYVIQFDADGQHLASEVKKLFSVMKKTGANIVIGSRFLEKTEYKHPFFRRIGTKMFSTIIKIFCKKTITDPTSGFQLLDRSVIERYAMMGKYPEFPDANLIIEMLLDGYEIEEVSVKMKECEDGVSMHGGIIKPIKYMVKVSYTIVFILIRGFSVRRNR